MSDKPMTNERPPIPGAYEDRRQRNAAAAHPHIGRRVLNWTKEHKPHPSSTDIKVGAAAAVVAILGLEGLNIINAPHQDEPNRIELGTTLIPPDAVLRTEPHVPTDQDVIDGKPNTNVVERDQITLKGQSLENQPIAVNNVLVVRFIDGNEWYIIEGVDVNGQPNKRLYTERSYLNDNHYDSNEIQAVTDSQGRYEGKSASGQVVVPPDQVELITLPKTHK